MSDVLTIVNMIPNLSSGETNQDSEPNLAVNPANPLEIAGTAFTPSPNAGSKNSPIFFSNDGGSTWSLKDLIAGTPVRDQTLRFATTSGNLYAGVLWGGGGISSINFDILRTNDFSGATTMFRMATRKNDDQPFVQAATVPSGPGAGKDRVYVGSNDHAPANIPATVDQSLDAAIAAPATSTFVIEGRTVARDGFQTRPAVHPNGTVYALFYAVLPGFASFDVVIVRDDNWASSATPYTALTDPGDLKQGLRIATGVNNPFLGLNIGQQRIGGDLSIAVDPNNSAVVYACWGDQTGGTYTLYVRKSTDSGATWSGNLRSIANATNPALAINEAGRLGFVYQQVTGLAPSQRWETMLELTTNDFGSISTYMLATTPASSPAASFQPYIGDYLYMMAVGRSFYGIFSANNTPDNANFPNGVKFQRNANFTTKTLLATDNVTPVAVSIDPFFFKVAPGTGRVVTGIADKGNFGHVCVGSFTDEELTIDNGGTAMLSITNIVSSSPDFVTPSVLSYPVKLGVGDAIDLPIRFEPTSLGLKAAIITVFSNDPAGPHKVHVSGLAQGPKLNLLIADTGSFGKVCVGSFRDEPLILNNGSHCGLTVTGATSSSPDFLVPEALFYPLLIGAGASLPLPIRFAPKSFGAKGATITVTSTDPGSPHDIVVKGEAPSGKLAVTGSLCFGGVKACCRTERVISICNVGECALHVSSVAFKRKSHHWKLVHNPFPATLHAGSCLALTVCYKANEKCPRACELIITSDDPAMPVKTLDVMAYTIWEECGCKREGHEHHKCGCDECRDDCCDDDDADDRDDE
ncbi:choice-of-anchor D domain-containing protein [Mesorhizobium sp. AR07]|uniref:choice-of-anchor D domain-containing protein n=1 Tax=Mesorhizobium sp. AR07 TaxID=2865838 RepID=UPI00215E09B3|nr:choice-of-anchor D domain-containing protein [Mesorhizobium sp. AR07]UVK47008.1 choice-of-anchor D domain-containing protein [Mesorhizobium sp. AR07]